MPGQKAARIPFTQSVPLFTVNRLGLAEESKSVLHGNTIYSDEIYAPSDHGFASLALQYVVNVLDSTGSCVVGIQYKIPGTSTWTTAVTIATLNAATPVKGANNGVVYRLDAVLNVNWIPNIPSRISFVFTGTDDADKMTFKGSWIV